MDIEHTLLKSDDRDKQNISLYGGLIEPIPKDG